jgi:cell division protein FtsW
MTTPAGTLPTRTPIAPELRRSLARLRRHAGERVSALPRHTPMSATMTAIVGFLVVLGLLMVLSTSSVLGLEAGASAWSGFNRQLVWALIGVGAFLATARVHYRTWRRFGPLVLVLAVVALVAVLVPGIGSTRDGARRWIEYGPIGFQPSELAKLGILCYAATLLDRRARHVARWRRVFFPVLAVVVVLGALVMLEPDLDTTIEIALIAFTVLLVGGVPYRQLAALAAAGVVATAAFVLAYPWRLSRLLSFLHPSDDPQGAGYQTRQSIIHIANGGLGGVGPGQGRGKWDGGTPAVHTDFIFSNIGEELGLLGGLVVLGLFVLFAVVGFRIALRIGERDRFGMLLAAGATAWVCFQAVINAAMACGLLPVTGTPLPFISVGGSSLVSFMVAAGILVNLARHCEPRPIPRSASHPAVIAAWARARSRPALG